jgi:hypothetical protein
MIVDYRLLFPTGSVVAHLINSFHTQQGAYAAKFCPSSECKMEVSGSFYLPFWPCGNVRHLFRLQVAAIFKTFLGSFSWSMFQWFFAGGDNCGFQAFPMFGLELYKRNRWEIFSRLCLTQVLLVILLPRS